MLPAIVVVLVALIALNASYGFSLPLSSAVEDGGYIVVTNHPRKLVQVETVDANGNTKLKEYEIYEDLNAIAKSTIPPHESNKLRNTCDWKQLYSEYLIKRKLRGLISKLNVTTNQKEVRDAFKVVCANPQKALEMLLRIRTADLP